LFPVDLLLETPADIVAEALPAGPTLPWNQPLSACHLLAVKVPKTPRLSALGAWGS